MRDLHTVHVLLHTLFSQQKQQGTNSTNLRNLTADQKWYVNPEYKCTGYPISSFSPKTCKQDGHLVFSDSFFMSWCDPHLTPSTLAHTLTCCQSDYSSVEGCSMMSSVLLWAAQSIIRCWRMTLLQICATLMLHNFSVIQGNQGSLLAYAWRVPLAPLLNFLWRMKWCQVLLK